MPAKKRAVLYPYDLESFPLLQGMDHFKEYRITDVVSPPGWGLTGCSAGSIYGIKDNLTVASDFQETLKNCDAVIFVDSCVKLDYTKSIRPKIFEAIAAGKDIVCTMVLQENQMEEIRSSIEEKGLNFVYGHHYGELKSTAAGFTQNYSLREPKAPVILVAGNGERANKFAIQLSLRERFLKAGYKIIQIGSKSYCELLGFNSFPQFMYDPAIHDTGKIVLFNQFINVLDKEENPDAIIIGVPGGTMPYNEKFHNHFGMLNYMVSQAISPDFVIYSTLYEDYPVDYYERIKVSAKYKFGYEINCFNLASTKINWQATFGKDSVQYMNLDQAFVKDKLSKQQNKNIPIFNALDDASMTAMFAFTIGSLEHNGQAISV